MRAFTYISRFPAALLIAALLCLAAPAAKGQVAFDRGMKEKITFVPKGEWIAGVSVSYSAQNYNDYQFLILESLKGNGYTFKVSPMCLYAFAPDLAAGGRFSYSRSLVKLNSASITLASDMGYDVDHLYSLSHSYGGNVLFRNYIPLGTSTRFGIFNEVRFEISGGQSKLATGTGQSLSGTYSRQLNIGVGVTPGVIMFLNNYAAMEVNIGVLGFNYHDTKMTTDQIHIANMKRKSANFKINLFSITFGTVFYI